MSFWDDAASFGEGLVGMGGGGTANDIGKGVGMFMPWGAATAVGAGFDSAGSAFGGGGGSGFGNPGLSGLAGAMGGAGGGGVPPGGVQAYQPTAAPSFLTPQATAMQGFNPNATAAQNGLLGQLQAQASGQAPSLADQQMHQGMEANARNAMSMSAASRNPAMAMYNAGNQVGGANAQMTGQAADARLQERMMAQQGLAGLSNQMQGQTLQNAGMMNQFAMQNAQMGQQGNEYYNTLQSGQSAANNNFLYQQALQQQQQDADMKKAVIGGALSAGGGLAQLAAA